MAYSKKLTKEQRKAIKSARRERNVYTRTTNEKDINMERHVRAVSRYGK